MILYPAIDLKGGACVRLLKGEMDAATVFNTDPGAQAALFAAAGARWIHVVDLDGAVAGRSVNGPAVEAILAAVSVPVQLGGGIRDMAAIEAWIAKGISRVILGTVALRDPDLLRAACATHPGRIAVGIDARGGRVAVSGWVEQEEMTVEDLAERVAEAGAAAIIHTDIDRDGTLSGVNIEATAALARRLRGRVPVIASGGVGSMDDLRAAKAARGDGVAGIIVGRALYDGRVELGAGLALLEA